MLAMSRTSIVIKVIIPLEVSFVSFSGEIFLTDSIDDFPICAIRLLRTLSSFGHFTWPMRVAQPVYMFIYYLQPWLLL